VRQARTWIALVALIIVATAVATVVLPDTAEAVGIRGKLRAAKHALRESRTRLNRAEAALAAAMDGALAGSASTIATADPAAATAKDPAVDQLRKRVRSARRAVRRWTRLVERLDREYRLQRQIADWERRAKWMPIIEIAANRYHVKADGIYRMMMRESGGRRFAGADGAFKGLFQYWTGTWTADWNPWRRDSIYDGSSQIFATCYAVSRGMGPQMWTTTFASQY